MADLDFQVYDEDLLEDAAERRSRMQFYGTLAAVISVHVLLIVTAFKLLVPRLHHFQEIRQLKTTAENVTWIDDSVGTPPVTEIPQSAVAEERPELARAATALQRLPYARGERPETDPESQIALPVKPPAPEPAPVEEKTEPPPEPEPEPKPVVKEDPPKPKPEPAPVVEARKPEPLPKPKPKPEPKPEPAAERKADPTPAPTPKPKAPVVPKLTPAPAPKPEPIPAPKPSAKPEPKPSPKLTPAAEPAPVPAPAKPAPKPKPKPKLTPAKLPAEASAPKAVKPETVPAKKPAPGPAAVATPGPAAAAPQTGAPAAVSAPGPASDLSGYHRLIHDTFHRNWRQPKSLPPGSSAYQTKVKITIARNGTIVGTSVVKSSGNLIMDGSVLKAVQSVRQIAPLPNLIESATYSVIINFQLD